MAFNINSILTIPLMRIDQVCAPLHCLAGSAAAPAGLQGNRGALTGPEQRARKKGREVSPPAPDQAIVVIAAPTRWRYLYRFFTPPQVSGSVATGNSQQITSPHMRISPGQPKSFTRSCQPNP